MTAIERPSYEPGSPEWHQQRVRSIGGSEIAPLLGIGKWDSRFSLWHRKQGTLAPQADNPGMEWGRRLEAVIAGKYADEHPDFNVRPGGTWTRTDRTWQIAAPDRIIHGDPAAPERFLLEVKTSYDADGWGQPGTDQIPVYYRAQCIWYLDVLDLDRCDVAVLIGGSDYREYTISYVAAEAEFMRAEAEAFIATLDSGERPRIDEHSATYQAIRELHPEIEPESVELPAPLVKAYCSARHALKDAEAEAALQRSLVADAMGSAQYAKFLDQTIARRQAKGGGKPYIVAADNLPTFNSKVA